MGHADRVEFQAQPRSCRVLPEVGAVSRKHVDGDETRVSKCQTLWIGASGRRGLGRLHPARETRA